jgi:hypothetical protein
MARLPRLLPAPQMARLPRLLEVPRVARPSAQLRGGERPTTGLKRNPPGFENVIPTGFQAFVYVSLVLRGGSYGPESAQVATAGRRSIADFLARK